jgi:hypothetical protein
MFAVQLDGALGRKVSDRCPADRPAGPDPDLSYSAERTVLAPRIAHGLGGRRP